MKQNKCSFSILLNRDPWPFNVPPHFLYYIHNQKFSCLPDLYLAYIYTGQLSVQYLRVFKASFDSIFSPFF